MNICLLVAVAACPFILMVGVIGLDQWVLLEPFGSIIRIIRSF